jgi:hypothetical protein
MYFLDIEASSFSLESYPIQIAWGSPNGNIECHLINPKHIDGWKDWSQQAQSVHRLNIETLIENGQHPREVAERINQCLEGHEVWSDAPVLDTFWLGALFEAVEFAPKFQLYDATKLFERSVLDCAMPQRALADAYRIAAERTQGRRHSADGDVEYLINVYRACFEVR